MKVAVIGQGRGQNDEDQENSKLGFGTDGAYTNRGRTGSRDGDADSSRGKRIRYLAGG
ncbi:hypothetical protein GCM10010965_16400 [Caldalkalibacillus thermarum]|nr:hypothetical protein GCM10010965_16400 [Caldalkalibacillus thermarum]